MKKVIASAGLVALGVAGAQAAYSPGLSSMEASKAWTVSAAVRGFYDDNYLTVDDSKANKAAGIEQKNSFGIELRPSLTINLPMDQTLLTFGYTYSMKWYENRDRDTTDQAHILNLGLDHAFSEIYRVTVTDAFAYTAEPDLANGAGGATQRSDHNNLYNRAAANFHAQFTEQWGGVLGYQNTIVNYQDSGYSATLDRMEHLFIANARWQALPKTVFVLGYNFGIVGYTADDVIAPGMMSDDRDSTSHYVYIGADHTFNPNLTLSTRWGYQTMDFDNGDVGDSSGSPYADNSLSWSYLPGCSATFGIRATYTATDVVAPDANGDVTGGSQTFAGYLNILHHFTPALSAGLLGTIQQNTFDGGAYDSDTEMIGTVGLSLAYQINPYLAAETGYDFDSVNSDVGGRDYQRNRVYIGLKGSY